MVRLPSIKDINITHKLFYKYNSLNQVKDILTVWTAKDSFIEIVGKNEAFWEKVSINIKFFFKRFVARLLAINPFKFCGTCQKMLLEKLEISSKETNMQSICCDHCRI